MAAAEGWCEAPAATSAVCLWSCKPHFRPWPNDLLAEDLYSSYRTLIQSKKTINKQVGQEKIIHCKLYAGLGFPEHGYTNPLLHWSSPIRSDILRAVASKISSRIGEDQCNNGLIFIPYLIWWCFEFKKYLFRCIFKRFYGYFIIGWKVKLCLVKAPPPKS